LAINREIELDELKATRQMLFEDGEDVTEIDKDIRAKMDIRAKTKNNSSKSLNSILH
jgi:hypothetical protein